MTDNDIVKALELCGSEYECHNGCPYYNNGQFKCRDLSIYRDALDLINRQKAELEKNENIIRLADKTIETANAEIERLQQYYDDMQGAIYEFREDHAKVKFFKKEIKAEAYREFAERLKEKSSALARLWIDNELKELVGEDK